MGRTNERKAHRTDSSKCSRSNIVGKFTQSVKRIVQEVKEEGVPADGETRDEAIATNERLRWSRLRLRESSERARAALLRLAAHYAHAARSWNLFAKYRLLKDMIKEVVRLETEYWQLLEVPRQEKQEPVLAYVLRACSVVEKGRRPHEEAERPHEEGGGGEKKREKKRREEEEEEEEKRDNAQRLNGMTTSQILEENNALTNELYRLLRKYSSLRTLIRELKDDYVESKMYPIIPRYFMLKEMIHDVMRDSAFVEICQEVTQSPPTAAS